MAVWDHYPENYRVKEIDQLLKAIRAGECAAVLGLSGSGKSNLIGFLAGRKAGLTPSSVMVPALILVRVDCNRIRQPDPDDFYRLVLSALEEPENQNNSSPLDRLIQALNRRIETQAESLCLLLDRFDSLMPWGEGVLTSNLRALRDDHKYRLTYVITSRRPPAAHTELAELFYGCTFWLGPLSEKDARWSAGEFVGRAGQTWTEDQLAAILDISGRYPSFLRAVCQAAADGAALTAETLVSHPAVHARLAEFWADQPTEDMLRASGLVENRLLSAWRKGALSSDLTAKEQRLLDYFSGHNGQICEKDDLILAVWPEDQVFNRGLRDDSLAQLVRRLREKIEPDPSHPVHIITVPGRGYRFNNQDR